MPSTHRPILCARCFTGRVSRCPVLDLLRFRFHHYTSCMYFKNYPFVPFTYGRISRMPCWPLLMLPTYNIIWHAGCLFTSFIVFCASGAQTPAHSHEPRVPPCQAVSSRNLTEQNRAPIRLLFVNCLKRGYADPRPAIARHGNDSIYGRKLANYVERARSRCTWPGYET
jgi:hypothetical protein